MVQSLEITSSPAERATSAAQFALLGDPLRLQIVESLAREQLCTCHLIDITGAKQTTVSHHLRLLREAGAIIGEADGRFTWYRLAPAAFSSTLARLGGIEASGDAPRLRMACTS